MPEVPSRASRSVRWRQGTRARHLGLASAASDGGAPVLGGSPAFLGEEIGKDALVFPLVAQDTLEEAQRDVITFPLAGLDDLIVEGDGAALLLLVEL